MENFNKVVELAGTIQEQNDKMTAKFTKAESKRTRATLTELKKLITLAKSELKEKDKSLTKGQ